MRAAKREQERAWKQAMKVRAWPPAMRFMAGELELRGFASPAAVLTHVHGDLGLRVARMGTEVGNVRAVRQIEAAGPVPVREGSHTLPNGRVITGRWYHHVAG